MGTPDPRASQPDCEPREQALGPAAPRPWRAAQGLGRLYQIPVRALRTIPRNEKIIYQEVTFQAIVEAGAMSFMAIFLVRLGSPNLLVGLYTSLPALVAIFVVLPIGAYVQSNRSLVATANWS